MSTSPRQRWLRGDCFCCGGPLEDPVTVTEDVRICGSCHEHGHDGGTFRTIMLDCLVTGRSPRSHPLWPRNRREAIERK